MKQSYIKKRETFVNFLDRIQEFRIKFLCGFGTWNMTTVATYFFYTSEGVTNYTSFGQMNVFDIQ